MYLDFGVWECRNSWVDGVFAVWVSGTSSVDLDFGVLECRSSWVDGIFFGVLVCRSCWGG